MPLGVRVSVACAKIHDEKMRGILSRHIEIDEIWGFIGKKRKNTKDFARLLSLCVEVGGSLGLEARPGVSGAQGGDGLGTQQPRPTTGDWEKTIAGKDDVGKWAGHERKGESS